MFLLEVNGGGQGHSAAIWSQYIHVGGALGVVSTQGKVRSVIEQVLGEAVIDPQSCGLSYCS